MAETMNEGHPGDVVNVRLSRDALEMIVSELNRAGQQPADGETFVTYEVREWFPGEATIWTSVETRDHRLKTRNA